MRVGAFEFDPVFQSVLSIAEVYSGHAPLLRSVHLRNVRGSETDWLKISAMIGSGKTKQKAVRNLSVQDESAAIACENALRTGLLLPSGLQPGPQEGELRIAWQDGEKAIPFSLTILPSSWIPTDLAHAPLWASWIRAEDDELRAFASDALGTLGNDQPVVCLEKMYDALIKRELMYQPVSSTVYPDFQVISDPHYALNKGGSCADLSLLTASLLWIRGLSPALLLYPGHVTAGCFAAGFVPEFEVLNDADVIEKMVLSHQLILPEMTAVCAWQQRSFEESLNMALDTLRERSSGCCLVNVKSVLRNDKARLLPDNYQAEPLQCPHCGYDHLVPQNAEGDTVCPACGKSIDLHPRKQSVQAPAPETPYDPSLLRYEVKNDKAGVSKCLSVSAESVRILPRWQNKPVTYIAERAFENCSLSSVSLPDSVTDIQDRAFRNCEKLNAIRLPEDCSRLGSGAFSSSGLRSIRIPGSVSRIPVLCFSGCSQLETVTFEEGILEIDSQAFLHCPKLKTVCLPSSVRTVSRSAFDSTCNILFASDRTRIL